MYIKDNNSNHKPFHTIKDVAEICDVSIKTVRRWIQNDELIAHHLGHQYRISDSDLQSFLARKRMVTHDHK